MAKPKPKLPTEEELKDLTRWARVTLLARAVRRIQPLYLHGWPAAPKKLQQAIERAIAFGESAAAQGKAPAGSQAFGLGAMAAYGKEPDEITFSRDYVHDVPNAASRVAFACSESQPMFASEGLEDAQRAANYFERVTNHPCVRVFTQLIRDEFALLLQVCKQEKWKKDTPVPEDLLGPLWPEGSPPGWPAPAPSRKKAVPLKPLDLKPLKLPRELVAFFKSGKRLKYAAAKTEVGPVVLHPLEHLELRTFEVERSDAAATGRSSKGKKPKRLVVNAVDLVAECDAYGPDGILAWLPVQKCFAQWDPDHLQLFTFPGTKWSDIVAKPAKYLDALWNDHADIARPYEP